MTGSEAVGWSRSVAQNWLLKLVNSSGAVSPATRATPRIMPVMMPCLAAGTTTVQDRARLAGAQRQRPSRSESGTARRNCSVARRPIGIIITLRAKPPARPKNGACGTTMTVQAKMPITMEGTPFSRSAV